MTTTKVEIPPKLIPLFTGKARYRCAFGGRGSGKTRTFAKMAAIRGYMLAEAGETGVIVCGREFMNSLDDSSMAEVKAAIASEDWLTEYYEVGEKFIRTKNRRISFSFVGLRHNLESLKSKAKIHILWVDEAEPVTPDGWMIIAPTVREDDSEIWVTWNPASKRSATHQRFREVPPTGAKVVEINYRDNPWFPAVLEQERLDDLEKRPEQYSHIWEGDFRTVFEGAYYANELAQARAEERICRVPHDKGLPVHTSWDLGFTDATAIWFCQIAGREVRWIDYYEGSGLPLEAYVKVLREKPYTYGKHYLPHDVRANELIAGKSRFQTLVALGIVPIVVPAHDVLDGINATRRLIGKSVFDADKTAGGLDAIAHYRREFNDNKQIYNPRPLHDWTSHAADALRMFAAGFAEPQVIDEPGRYQRRTKRASSGSNLSWLTV